MIELDVISQADVLADGQPRQWRSFAHRDGAAGIEALIANEFHPAGTAPAEDGDEPSRRSFLKTVGASMALASVGMAGCRRPVEHVMPYVRQPEEVLPGVPNMYATGMPLGGVVHPLLVQSHEGRPTKIEGNPEHPASLGKSSVHAQASILNLYDPDRTRFVRRDGQRVAWREFVSFARQVRGNAETRVAVLCEASSSLTLGRLREQLLAQFPNATWVTHHPTGERLTAEGVNAVAGAPLRPLYRFGQARTIVSFDADFLSDPIAGVWNQREFAESRRVLSPDDEMSRLYAIESTLTMTGGTADHRLRMKASDIPFFAAAVAARLGEEVGTAAQRFAGDQRVEAFVAAIAEDVQQGDAVFVAGPTQPASVHALCARLNAAHAGGTVSYLQTDEQGEDEAQIGLPELTAAMRAGQVDLLVVIGANPAYDAPEALGFAEAMRRVPASVCLTMHRDETARNATWVLPRTHFLEAWGEGRALDGTITAIQPLISPLYEDARSEIELLNLLVTGEDIPGYALVRDAFQQEGLLTGPFEDAWRTLLHDGFLAGTAFEAAGAATGAPGTTDQLVASSPDEIELVFRSDPKLLDGAFSNNAWMIELPDPVSKVSWDNTAIISPATAQALGVRYREGTYEGGSWRAGRITASRVTITTPGGQLNLPVWVQPGHPDNSITVYGGWGRQLDTDRDVRAERGLLARIFDVDTNHYRPGPLANGVGVRVAHARPATGPAVIPSVEVEVTGETYRVATTQDHGLMMDRPIIRMASLEEYRRRPDFPSHAVPLIQSTPWEDLPPVWGEERAPTADPRIGDALYADHQWGMTVDLNTCTGCNACVIACQSENNIPIVGKSEIERGREMHWLRIDRYYVGESPEEAGMAVMPMFCQHCDYAPCESVCPVTATSQSPDGLNEMTYNRCIGTRYCSNNCPYKVRRFNWFNWNATLPLETRMQLNPNVTPRFRGVMEKCTFCVQRIRFANRVAHLEERKIRDGEVQTACEQACPSNAIVFGDLTDPDSRVSRMKRVAQRYELLAEYNTKPRLSYLARLSNPNPRLQAALGQPAA